MQEASTTAVLCSGHGFTIIMELCVHGTFCSGTCCSRNVLFTKTFCSRTSYSRNVLFTERSVYNVMFTKLCVHRTSCSWNFLFPNLPVHELSVQGTFCSRNFPDLGYAKSRSEVRLWPCGIQYWCNHLISHIYVNYFSPGDWLLLSRLLYQVWNPSRLSAKTLDTVKSDIIQVLDVIRGGG